MGDVALVLRHATTGSGDPTRALAAARNVCHILFTDRNTPDPTIPRSFWATPLGRAVARCCDGDTPATPPARHPLRLPTAMQSEVRAEIEALNHALAAQVSAHLRRRTPLLSEERRRAA